MQLDTLVPPNVMLLPKSSDAVHRLWLYRVLSSIFDNTILSQHLRFKGGTCAAMRNMLSRFSVDLDFDLVSVGEMAVVRQELEDVFQSLDLVVKDASNVIPQYFLRYETNDPHKRNTLKIDVTTHPPLANTYENVKLIDIDRFVPCQTIETLVANKLVAPLDRWKVHGSIAGRDMYDIHVFLSKGLPYSQAVIQERMNMNTKDFFVALAEFIQIHVTQTIVDQDINTLLPTAEFQKIRKSLLQETCMLVRSQM